jgi:hypothetical protein
VLPELPEAQQAKHWLTLLLHQQLHRKLQVQKVVARPNCQQLQRETSPI